MANTEKKNRVLFTILTICSVPALGFLAAGAAYLGFYPVTEPWPAIMLPPSAAILLLIFIETWREKKQKIASPILHILELTAIAVFVMALIWWFRYLIQTGAFHL